MPERTNDFFRTPLLNAIVICWINPVRGEYLGDHSWYIEGRVILSTKDRVIVNENGYKVDYTPKGCSYRNITNKPGPINRFLAFARTLPGARHVNFYDAQGRKPRAFLFRKVL